MILPRKYDVRESGVPERKVNVYCDGVKLERCVSYDLDSGFAIVISSDEDGKIIHNNGIVEYKNIYGKIDIEEIEKK